jgi:hypothetical protein
VREMASPIRSAIDRTRMPGAVSMLAGVMPFARWRLV